MRQQFKVLSGKLKRPGQRLQEVALFDEVGDPLSLGAPTDVRLLGTDIPMDNLWEVASIADWGDYPARIYKQGGRVYMSGAVVKGSAFSSVVATLPLIYAPTVFDESMSAIDSGATWRWALPTGTSNLIASSRISVTEDGIHLTISDGSGPLSEGDEIYLDGISWPLA